MTLNRILEQKERLSRFGTGKDVEGGIKLAEELAEVLGGVVGGSRATIDSGRP